ncbi:MAG: glycoside hydrolase family 3 protein [Myxococcales bacterium]|nr:glycoside hydrolase family 3 protein [Myxococcales bacterium]
MLAMTEGPIAMTSAATPPRAEPAIADRGRWLDLGLGLLRALLVIAALAGVLVYRTALIASLRGWILGALVVGVPLLLGLELRALLRARARAAARVWPRRLLVGLWALCAALLAITEGGFRLTRAAVLGADPERLAEIGAHIVVGFRDPEDLRDLVERDAIAGVYVSRRNITELGALTVARVLADLQARRRERGMPPLLVAADQEGGVVSHLSPPLTRMPPLSSLVDRTSSERLGELSAAASEYADTHGRELGELGVNLNFAPVVDLRVAVDRAFDRYTRIEARAIASDPALVIAAADGYCAGLRARRVACTLKHFPGIGRVREDTHYFAGHLTATRPELAGGEWRPFRTLAGAGEPSTLMMLSHTIVDAIDPEVPASLSEPVVDGLLRGAWGLDRTVLITDDLSMFPISLGPGGVGGASVDALAAGVDLLLISYDPDLYYEAAAELLDLWETLPRDRIVRARRRIGGLQGWIVGG